MNELPLIGYIRRLQRSSIDSQSPGCRWPACRLLWFDRWL